MRINGRRPPVVHKMIRASAIEMAAAVYDEVMRDNAKFAQWKAVCPELTPTILEIQFLELLWPHLIPSARATLATMLTTNIDEGTKEMISDALLADATLRRVASGKRVAPLTPTRH